MKLELKTENENYLKSLAQFFRTAFDLSLIIIFCYVAFKIGSISKHYQIEYNCILLSVEKSKSNFKKLSSLTNLKSKQRISEFCGRLLNKN